MRIPLMEIYMEKIKGLLNPDNDNLPIHEDKQKGVHVKDLTEKYVSSAAEVYGVMRQGSKIPTYKRVL
jgi:kinesin family protein 5